MIKIFFICLFVAISFAPQSGSIQKNPGSTADNCSTELRAAMSRMHESMSHVPAAASGDEDFVRLMIPHHQAALDMAKTQLLCGKDPQIRRLAQEIITDQQSEIDLMQLWLKKHATAASTEDISHH